MSLVPALVCVWALLFVWPVFGSGAWAQSSSGEAPPSQGEAPATAPQQPGQPSAQPQQPFFVPQYQSEYPPSFQLPQVRPFGATPTLPGAPAEGQPIPPWMPPVAPPPSQSHPPGGLPPGLLFAGPRKLFEFHPGLVVSEEWTDNFHQTATNRQTNYRTTVGPGGTLLINGASTTGLLSGNAGLTYDTVSNGEFHVFPSGTAAIQQVLTPRLSVTLSDTYTQNNNPTQADTFGLNTQRQTFTSNSFSAAVNYLIDRIATQTYYRNSIFDTGGTNGSNTTSNIIGARASSPVGITNTVSVGYEYSWSKSSGTSTGENSGQTTGNLFTASISRQLNQYASAGLSGSYQQSSPPEQDTTHIWNVSLLTAYGLPSGFAMSGSVGFSQVSSASTQTSNGVSTNSNLSYTFAKAVVSVGLFSDFRQTALEGQNFGIVRTQGYTGSLLYAFTPFVTGAVHATYTTNSFTGNGNNSSTPDSSSLTAGANLSWRVTQWLSATAAYSYLLRSDPTTGSLTGSGNIPVNTAIISLQAGF